MNRNYLSAFLVTATLFGLSHPARTEAVDPALNQDGPGRGVGQGNRLLVRILRGFAPDSPRRNIRLGTRCRARF